MLVLFWKGVWRYLICVELTTRVLCFFYFYLHEPRTHRETNRHNYGYSYPNYLYADEKPSVYLGEGVLFAEVCFETTGGAKYLRKRMLDELSNY